MSNMQYNVKIRKLADETLRGKLDFQRDEWEAMWLNRVHKMPTHAGELQSSLMPSMRGKPLLFIYLRVKSESSMVLVYIIKMDGFNIEQWCVQNESHIIKCHRHFLIQFPPYLNKTGIIPLGPTRFLCLSSSGFGRVSGSGRLCGQKQTWEKQRYPGNKMRNGKCLDGSFNKEDCTVQRWPVNLLYPRFFSLNPPSSVPLAHPFVSHYLSPLSLPLSHWILLTSR